MKRYLLLAAAVSFLAGWAGSSAGAPPAPSMPVVDLRCHTVYVCAVASSCTPDLVIPKVVCP